MANATPIGPRRSYLANPLPATQPTAAIEPLGSCLTHPLPATQPTAAIQLLAAPAYPCRAAAACAEIRRAAIGSAVRRRSHACGSAARSHTQNNGPAQARQAHSARRTSTGPTDSAHIHTDTQRESQTPRGTRLPSHAPGLYHGSAPKWYYHTDNPRERAR